jgi:hypothetical protein
VAAIVLDWPRFTRPRRRQNEADVRNLGGFKGWLEAGGEVEKA